MQKENWGNKTEGYNYQLNTSVPVGLYVAKNDPAYTEKNAEEIRDTLGDIVHDYKVYDVSSFENLTSKDLVTDLTNFLKP